MHRTQYTLWFLLGTVLLIVLVAALALGSTQPASSPTASAAAVRLPPPGGRLDYQLGGSYESVQGVRVVVRDWHTTPDPDRYSVCYVDAFQSQPEDRAVWLQQRRDLLLLVDGDVVEDPNWPDQYLFDTSTETKRARLAAIVEPWIRSCATKRFQAVELDNLDSWMRSSGRLTPAENLAFGATLVRAAHRLGLAVAQKNAAVLGPEGRERAGFDFAIAESCQRYDECDAYTSVYGRRVYEIEYTDTGTANFREACAVRGDRISVILRDRLMRPRGHPDYRYEVC